MKLINCKNYLHKFHTAVGGSEPAKKAGSYH